MEDTSLGSRLKLDKGLLPSCLSCCATYEKIFGIVGIGSISNTWERIFSYCSFNPHKNCIARSSCFRWAMVVSTKQVHLTVHVHMGSGLKFSISYPYDSQLREVFCDWERSLLNGWSFLLEFWNSQKVPLRVPRLQIIPNLFRFVHPQDTLSNGDGYWMDQPRYHHVVTATPCPVSSIRFQWLGCFFVYKLYFVLGA